MTVSLQDLERLDAEIAIAGGVEAVVQKAKRRKPVADAPTTIARRPVMLDAAEFMSRKPVADLPETIAQQSRVLDFRSLAGKKAPARHWFRQDWLGSGMTLLPGKGGEGKSGLAQHEATCGALGRPYFSGECDPYKSLVWNCEDEHDDLWRRQERICAYEEIDIDTLADRMVVESRYGCDNALMAEVRGELLRTRLLEDLRQQVNDHQIDVLWLDNAAHALAGNHDDRAQVTQFINALNGLVTGRPFAVVVLAHVSRAQGSEFTGSVAWENAARMRWYLGSKLPDQQSDGDSDQGGADLRYLCKRKSNYSARDYVRFSMHDGLLVPDAMQAGHVGGLVSALDEQRADELCIAGFKSLRTMGLHPTDGKTSPDYLPSQIAAKGLASGYSKSDIARAMNRLMARGTFSRGVVGKYANRSPKEGLVLNLGDR